MCTYGNELTGEKTNIYHSFMKVRLEAIQAESGERTIWDDPLKLLSYENTIPFVLMQLHYPYNNMR